MCSVSRPATNESTLVTPHPGVDELRASSTNYADSVLSCLPGESALKTKLQKTDAQSSIRVRVDDTTTKLSIVFTALASTLLHLPYSVPGPHCCICHTAFLTISARGTEQRGASTFLRPSPSSNCCLPGRSKHRAYIARRLRAIVRGPRWRACAGNPLRPLSFQKKCR